MAFEQGNPGGEGTPGTAPEPSGPAAANNGNGFHDTPHVERERPAAQAPAEREYHSEPREPAARPEPTTPLAHFEPPAPVQPGKPHVVWSSAPEKDGGRGTEE